MRRTAYLAIGLLASAAVVLPFVGCGNRSAGIPGTVASVNGKAIKADQFVQGASLQAGEQVLSRLIEQQIVLDWAEEEKLAPTKEQIAKQIDMLKREGVYDEQIKLIGEDSLNFEVKAMQARVNLVKKHVKISDEEVKSIYDNPMMKSRYVHGPRKRVAVVANSDKAQVEEAAKKLAAGEDLDKVAAQYAERGRVERGWVEDNQEGPMEVFVKAAKSVKVGSASEVFTIGEAGMPTQYAVLKVLQEQPKADLKFEDVKDEIVDMLAMQKAMDPEFMTKFNEKKKAAKIDIKMDRLASVIGQFKNPPDPNPFMGMPVPQGQPSAEPAEQPAPKPKN